MKSSKITDTKYYSENIKPITHQSNDSLLGVCCLDMIIFLFCLILIGPFIAIYFLCLIIVGIKRTFVEFINLCPNGDRNSRSMSRESLTFDEQLWMEYLNSSVIVTMIMQRPMSLIELQSVFTERVLQCRNEKAHYFSTIKRLSQFPSFLNSNWSWMDDPEFQLSNHVMELDLCPGSLSDILTQVSGTSYSMSKPRWNLYLVNCSVAVDKKHDSFFTEVEETESFLSPITEEIEPYCTIIFRIHSSMIKDSSITEILSDLINDKPEIIHLKSRFNPKTFVLKGFYSLFFGVIIFLKKWLCQKSDSDYYLRADFSQDSKSTDEMIDNDRFVFHRFSLSDINRLKSVTRSTFTEIILSLLTSALKQHHQVICKRIQAEDRLCLLSVNKSPNPRRFTFADVILPLSTEGMLPILWEVRQRMLKFRTNSEYVFLHVFPMFLKNILSLKYVIKLFTVYLKKSQLFVTTVKGTKNAVTINGNLLSTLLIWFPVVEKMSLSVMSLSYHDEFIVCLNSKDSASIDLYILVNAMKHQIRHLCKLLENRRVPSDKATGVQPEIINSSINKDTINVSAQSFESILDQLNETQIKLQNHKLLSDTEKDELRKIYSILFAALKERKRKEALAKKENDEENEETSSSQSRRSSLPSIVNKEIHKTLRRLSFPKVESKIGESRIGDPNSA